VDTPLGSRYVLHDLLGRGAMGQVFRGTVRGSGAPVAVKVLKPELVSDTEVVARFFQERSILTSIDHPNVAKVLDLVVEGDTLGIVMELVEGQDLRRYLRARGTLPPGEAVYLAGQLLQGLAAVHAAGVVHRDVKPENVLASTARGQMNLKLTDFGVSRLSYGASLTKMTSLIGTPEYMAPELADHDTATPAADLYSAGIVLYEMLAGRTPFAGGHPLAVLRRQVEQPPPPIPGAPAELWEQIESLLVKDPLSRPGSAAAALGRLAPLQNRLNGLPALPTMPNQLTPMPRQSMPGQSMPGQSMPGQSMPGQTVPGRGSGRTAPGREPAQTVLRARDRGQGPGSETASPIVTGVAGRAQRRRKAAIIALPAALVVVGAAVGLLLTRSPHVASPVSDAQPMATRHASPRSQLTPANTATSRTPTARASSQLASPTTSGTPTTQATSQLASPAGGSASSSPLPANPAIFTRDFGSHSSSNYVLDVLGQGEDAGQPIILFHTASSNTAENWTVAAQGTTAQFYKSGLVSATVAQHYGCIPGGNFSTCYGQTAVAVNDSAFEIEYAPNGVDSGLCMGVAGTAVQGEGVTLQPCGVSAKTVWIVDTFGSQSTVSGGYVPLINGSDTDFSQPFVLTYPTSGYPTDMPRPQLQVDTITGSSQGSPPGPALGTVGNNQLWGAD
jgi:serine/threonine-protein kinase